MKVSGDSWKFQLIPFDAPAAIESAELIAAVKNKKDPWDAWAKVKFDIQIVATAKAENASVIYSDDRDIENYAKRFNIQVVRICDLPLPSSPPTLQAAATGLFGPQMPLPLSPPSIPPPQIEPSTEERKPDESKPGDAAGTKESAL